MQETNILIQLLGRRFKNKKGIRWGGFCTLVYGKNLCQHGMTDMNQINSLIGLMDLNKDSEVLELGCGSVHISEYISKVTKAQINGIDLSPTAIELAVQRTKNNKNNLKFET